LKVASLLPPLFIVIGGYSLYSTVGQRLPVLVALYRKDRRILRCGLRRNTLHGVRSTIAASRNELQLHRARWCGASLIAFFCGCIG
jgi:hypothetical protein